MGKNVCEYEVAVNNAFRPRTLSWRSFKGSGRGNKAEPRSHYWIKSGSNEFWIIIFHLIFKKVKKKEEMKLLMVNTQDHSGNAQ